MAFTAPVPRPPFASPFDDVATAERRSHVVLGLGRSFTTLTSTREGRPSSHRFARHPRRRSRADDCALLGPRSLVPPPFFGRCVRAYSGPGCCLPTSATNHDVRTLSSGLPFPRRDDGHDHLPFLTRHARPTRVAPSSGDARRAAHSSVDLDPGAGSLPLSWVCPTAISEPPRHPPKLSPREFSDD